DLLVAASEAAMKRAWSLPLQAVCGEAIGLALAQGFGADVLTVVALVAMLASHVKLAAPRVIELLAFLKEGRRGSIDLDVDRHAARLRFDVDHHAQHLVAFPLVGLGLHIVLAAVVDALLERHHLLPRLEIDRIAGGDALHGSRRVPMAARAGLACL